MSVRWVLPLLGLVLAACGESAEPDRFDLRTPGAETGAPLTPTPEATATPRAKASPTPEPTPKPRGVTRAERRIVRGWSDALRRGNVAAASRYFSVPALAVNPDPAFLATASDVKAFNRDLPCGAKLVKMRRSAEPTFVVGIFRLTERPGAGEVRHRHRQSRRGRVPDLPRPHHELDPCRQRTRHADPDAEGGAEPDADARRLDVSLGSGSGSARRG